MIFYLIILQQILYGIHSTSLVNQENARVKLYNDQIRNSNYSIYSKQLLSLNYGSYANVYGMHLSKIIDQSQGDSNQDQDNLQQQSNDASYHNLIDGCAIYDRQIGVSQQDQISLGLQWDDDTFFTDMAVLPMLNKSFILKNNYEIVQVFLDENSIHSSDFSFNFIGYLNKTAQLSEQMYYPPQLFIEKNKQNVFIITQYGALSFDGNKNLTLDLEIKIQKNFKQRSTIQNIYYDQNRNVLLYKQNNLPVKKLFIANGLEGVDVYSVQEGQLYFVATIDDQILELNGIDIIDVSINEDGSMLYILDSHKGFFTVDVQNYNNIHKLYFNIPITNARAFDHYQNTFIFIANSIHNQDYAVEVFVDFKNNEYYFNRFYRNEMLLFDVVVFDTYALLIGDDAHKIIYHSIYNGFIDNYIEHQTIFTQSNLNKIVEYKRNKISTVQQLVGLGKSQFTKFNIKFVNPIVRCRFSDPTQQTFLLTMNSTQCNKKTQSYDQSQFSQCQINHQFTLSVKDGFLFSSQIRWITAIISIILLVIFLLSLTLYICWKKWRQNIIYLDNLIIDLRRREKYEQQVNIQLSDQSITDNRQKDQIDIENS